jgi:hypothetical protein
MSQLGEAVARYHKILESDPYKDLSWAHTLQERMQEQHLAVSGRPVSPTLRPHFLTRRQYTNLVKAAESLFTSIRRVESMALSNPALLSRMELLPAEKMLAAVDPGYPFFSVMSLLDTHLHNGTVRFARYTPDTPVGAAYGDALSDLFYDAPPVKEFRKKYGLTKLPGMKHLLHALLKAYKEWGGKTKKPNIGILEFRQPFQTSESGENVLIRDYFRKEGFACEIISPDQLEYRNNVLRSNGFTFELIYRRIKVQEFLIRYDLLHPLLRAYREGKVCVVNNFRSEVAQKKAIFDLLTDENITSGFPAAERKVIREFVPWTRVVQTAKTMYQDEEVDLPDFILKNRESLVLRPNDDSTEHHAFLGSETDDAGWEKALKTAMRNTYVVQEVVEPVHDTFPLLNYGHMEMRKMRVDIYPHSYLGKVQGCSSWLSAAGTTGFSSVSGVAPTYILDVK